MRYTLEDFVAAAILAVLFCPALYGCAAATIRAIRGTLDRTRKSFKSGVRLHVLNILISPGIPASLLYADIRTGGGSVASLLSIPIIPVTWSLYVIASRRIAAAASAKA